MLIKQAEDARNYTHSGTIKKQQQQHTKLFKKPSHGIFYNIYLAQNSFIFIPFLPSKSRLWGKERNESK